MSWNSGSLSYPWILTQTSIISSSMEEVHSSTLILLRSVYLRQDIWSLDFHSTSFTQQFHSTSFTQQDIWTLQQEVMLQQMSFMLLLNHKVRSKYFDNIQTMAEKEALGTLKVAAAFKISPNRFTYYDPWKSSFSNFLNTLHQKVKPRLKQLFIGIVDRLLQGNSNKEYGTFVFINVTLLKLKEFMNLKPNLIDPVKKQMQFLEEMLNYAPIIARKMENLDENLQNFLEFIEPWINTAAAIVILYWVDEKLISIVSSSLQKFNLSILEYVEAYILVLKALRPSNVSEILVMRNTVEKFTKMILEEFIVFTDYRFDMFREGQTFWTALLVDPPKADAEDEKLICSQINLLLEQAKSLICSLGLMQLVGDERRNNLLNDFLEKINNVKVEVRQLHVHQIPGLSWNNAPKTSTRGFFGSLLGNLQKKLEAEVGVFLGRRSWRLMIMGRQNYKKFGYKQATWHTLWTMLQTSVPLTFPFGLI